MSSVLEMPARPDSREAREAGDIALLVLLSVMFALVAAASLAVRPASTTAVAVDPPRDLPVLAAGAGATNDAWTGAALTAGRLVLTAHAENGRTATLRGGEAWSDYTLRARVKWQAGKQLAFHVRESAEGDYVACVLEDTTARIDEVTGGVARTLARSSAPALAGSAFDAMVVVDGDRVGFAVDGATVAMAKLTHASRGTAGIGVTDARWGRASVEAEYVRVEPITAPLTAPRRLPAAAVLREGADTSE